MKNSNQGKKTMHCTIGIVIQYQIGVRSFARRTFTTPKIRTFTTPKKKHLPGGQLPPPFFSFFGALFLAFSTYSSWRTSRMGRRRCLTRWSWSTSSRGCVTRWSWSTSSRRCLTSWSWSTSTRGRRWKRSPQMVAERHSHGGDRKVGCLEGQGGRQGRGEVGRALCFCSWRLGSYISNQNLSNIIEL